MKRDLTTLLVPFVYFIAGAVSLASVAATFFYKETLGLSIEQTQILGSISIIPWSIKPLYGLFSDYVPLWGLRRKPYLMLAGLLSSTGYFMFAAMVDSFIDACVALVVAGVGIAIADVIVDGIVAEKSRSQKEAGKLQSICRGAIMLGAISVAYLSGYLVEAIGIQNVYLVTAIFPLFTCIFALFIQETEVVIENISLRDTWKKIRDAISPPLLWATLFLFLWRATPSSGGALNYYVIDELSFTPEFFGRLAMVSHVMSLVGVIAFRKFLISVNIKKLFVGIIFASVILSLPTLGLVYKWYEVLGLSPQLFALADTFISAPLTEIGYIPLMVVVARICPKGIEATLFAILASIMNIGLVVSDMGGALLVNLFDVHQATGTLAANYTHLDKVLWIAILSSFIPLPFIKYLPNITAAEDSGHSPSSTGSTFTGLSDKNEEIS